MHRNITKLHRARRKITAGKHYWRSDIGQKKSRKQHTEKQQNVSVSVGDEWYEEADWDDAEVPGKDSGKIRQRIESLRKERQLQQALRDTFDC